MITTNDKTLCCGCGACAQACPTGCIAMKEDEEGFLYPSIDREKCVNCGKCEEVCPILQVDRKKENKEGLFEEPFAVGGWHRDQNVRNASSSGGAFSLFANEILKQGGVVFGAAMNGCVVEHTSAVNEEELAKQRGSKYVQSRIGTAYQQVKKYLEEGRKVLFSGTPCQTAGLVSFLGRKHENLWLVDFICHGVPSPKVFAQYLESLEKKKGSKVTAFSFREKDKGWKPSGLQLGTKITFADGTVLRKYPAFRDTYMNGFLEDLILRPSCYECRFKEVPKWGADFTIADFWGVNQAKPELNDGRGTSLVLINTEQGRKLFKAVKENFHGKKCDWKTATKKNPTLVRPARRPALRDRIFGELEELGYAKVARKRMSTGKTVMHKSFRILKGKVKKSD